MWFQFGVGKEKKQVGERLKSYSHIDASKRGANANKEGEGGVVGVVERDEVVEVGDVGVLVIEEHTVLFCAIVVGHGWVYVMPSIAAPS